MTIVTKMIRSGDRVTEGYHPYVSNVTPTLVDVTSLRTELQSASQVPIRQSKLSSS